MTSEISGSSEFAKEERSSDTGGQGAALDGCLLGPRQLRKHPICRNALDPDEQACPFPPPLIDDMSESVRYWYSIWESDSSNCESFSYSVTCIALRGVVFSVALSAVAHPFGCTCLQLLQQLASLLLLGWNPFLTIWGWSNTTIDSASVPTGMRKLEESAAAETGLATAGLVTSPS